MECPLCGLFCPPEASFCDCGYSFAHKPTASVQLEVIGRRNMLLGAVAFFAGVAATVITFTVAKALAEAWGGCVYVIAWGPIFFGSIQFFRGYRQYRRSQTPPVRPDETKSDEMKRNDS